MKREKRKKPEGNRKERSGLFRYKYHAEDSGTKTGKKKSKPGNCGELNSELHYAKAGRCHGGWFWAGTRLKEGRESKPSFPRAAYRIRKLSPRFLISFINFKS